MIQRRAFTLGCSAVAAIGALLGTLQLVAVSDSSWRSRASGSVRNTESYSESILGANLSPADAVTASQRNVDDSDRAIARMQKQISAMKRSLADARTDQYRIPGRIKDLESEIQRLTGEVVQSKKELLIAERDYAEFSVLIESRKSAARSFADSARRTNFEHAVDDIKRARKERNDWRAKVGAFPEDQSEVEHELNKTRAAKVSADQSYLAFVTREYAKIETENRQRAATINLIQKNLAAASSKRTDFQIELRESQRTLLSLPVVIATLPSNIERLDKELVQLIKLKNSWQESLRNAQFVLQRHNEESVAARERAFANARREQSPKNVITNDSTGAFLDRDPGTKTWPATQFAKSSGPYSVGSQYYSQTYRPPVGEQRVRAHFRSDGTYVNEHVRTHADDSFWNNWSSYGNTNPRTGRVGSRRPPNAYGGDGITIVRDHVRSNGTYVRGHIRRK